jgi:hypothetical protein
MPDDHQLEILEGKEMVLQKRGTVTELQGLNTVTGPWADPDSDSPESEFDSEIPSRIVFLSQVTVQINSVRVHCDPYHRLATECIIMIRTAASPQACPGLGAS